MGKCIPAPLGPFLGPFINEDYLDHQNSHNILHFCLKLWNDEEWTLIIGIPIQNMTQDHIYFIMESKNVTYNCYLDSLSFFSP